MAILDYLNPLKSIAKELRIIRELYERDLAERDKPIIRVTEKPRKRDTEITYSGEDQDENKSALKKLVDEWEDIGDDEVYADDRGAEDDVRPTGPGGPDEGDYAGDEGPE